MVDIFEHCTRLDTATVEERRDLVQVVPDGGKLPCDSFDLVRVDIEHICDGLEGAVLLIKRHSRIHLIFQILAGIVFRL